MIRSVECESLYQSVWLHGCAVQKWIEVLFEWRLLLGVLIPCGKVTGSEGGGFCPLLCMGTLLTFNVAFAKLLWPLVITAVVINQIFR